METARVSGLGTEKGNIAESEVFSIPDQIILSPLSIRLIILFNRIKSYIFFFCSPPNGPR